MGEPSPFGPGNPDRPSLRYLFLRFLRHGLLAWGGPVAQIGLMHRELVERDAWIGETRFRKVLALYQALPGPEAHELAVYFGMLKRGRWGAVATGLAFMLPGVLLITLLAALYVRYAATLQIADALLYGARPAILALVAVAFVRLARASLTRIEHIVSATAAALIGFLRPDAPFLLVLLAGAALGWAGTGVAARRLLLVPLVAFPAFSPAGLGALAWLALKVGLLTFGGAYTAVPILHQGAVTEHAWLTNAQFLDALALSSLVPGPLIAVGTFVGYEAAGLAGAALATLLIFAPAFAFTLVGHAWFERIVENEQLHAALLGVAAAVIGLILPTLAALGQAAIFDATTAVLALACLAATLSRRIPLPFVILAGSGMGLAARAL